MSHTTTPPAERRELAFALLGALIMVIWCAAVASGLGRALLGSDAAGLGGLLLYLPGILLGSGLIAYAAWRRMRLHVPRWVPAAPAPAEPEPANGDVFEEEPEDLGSEPLPASMVRRTRPPQPELAIVHLGAGVDPAYAPWALKWEASGHGVGLVPLPVGGRLVLGRDPAADIVARLDQVSWHHLELDVQEGRVIAYDADSSNGTRRAPDDEPLPPREPIAWAPGDALHLASPVALTLTLEPLR